MGEIAHATEVLACTGAMDVGLTLSVVAGHPAIWLRGGSVSVPPCEARDFTIPSQTAFLPLYKHWVLPFVEGFSTGMVVAQVVELVDTYA